MVAPRERFLIGLLFCALLTVSVDAQLFGGGGLFGGGDDEPRPLTEAEIGVPTPKTGQVQAVKGQEVRFQLEAGSKAPGAAVEFLIRTMPTAGKIVSLVENPNARNRAVVTYYADPSTSADKDVFGFAVRYRGGRWSSEMRFDIDLVDVKAEIQATEDAEFGEVMIGEEAVREITVRNLGTGDFDRQIYLNSPWRIVEPANGRLMVPAKQARTVKVGFRPRLVGETSYFLSFSRSEGATTKLVGSGTDPFSVENTEAQLLFDPESRDRVGEIRVLNRSPKPMRLALRASARIRKGLPEMILAPPGRPYPIEVELPAEDTAPFDGMLQVTHESGYSQSARLVAAVVPGELRVDIPNSLATDVMNFGRVGAGRSVERGFRLENIGGVAVPLEFHIPDPFRLLNDPGLQLQPGASVNIAIGAFPAAGRKGLVDVTMSVLGPNQDLPIRLLANVIPGKGSGGSEQVAPESILKQLGQVRMRSGRVAATSDPDREPVGRDEKDVPGLPPIGNLSSATDPEGYNEPREGVVMKGMETKPLLRREFNQELRSPEDLSLVASDSGSLTIGWTAPPDSELSRFDVELAGFAADPDSGKPSSVWVPYGDVEFERVDRLVKAEIKGLAPASTYHFRVFTVDENGRSSPPSEAMSAATELPMDWTWIYASLGIGFIVLLGLGIWKVIKDRRPEVYQAKYADM